MRTLLLGFDAFDPDFFEHLSEKGLLPNLTRFINRDGYARFQVSNPPQSEVSWTSIATGLNPGEHGIFDFVHRDPATYTPYVSLIPTARKIGGIQFVRPSNATTIFDQAAQQGYAATSLWWPATFPASPESPVRTLPGLGTPDIQGRLGVGTLYSTNPDAPDKIGKTPVRILKCVGQDCYEQEIVGPTRANRGGPQPSTLRLELQIIDDQTAKLKIGKQIIEVTKGKWTPILEISFKLGRLITVRTITRFILAETEPHLRLYFLPLQLHPLHSPWRYGSPRRFVNQVWRTNGPFLTLGWPQDTTGLEDGCIDDDQFLDLCASVFAARVRVFFDQLSRFQEGLLASVFDTLDRIQHMFWKNHPEVIEKWYRKLDRLVDDVETALASHPDEQAKIVIVSDHGFANFDHKVHLNRWLIDQGYMKIHSGASAGNLKDVDWYQTQAYAIGLNSIYLNLTGREAKGILRHHQRDEIIIRLCRDLGEWRGADDSRVVNRIWENAQAFTGKYSSFGPDLVIGFSTGYRASSQTGLGAWESISLEPNMDHWEADHCIDPDIVPGVIFSNESLSDFRRPSYRDIPAIAIGTQPIASDSPPPRSLTSEESDTIEERLKSLGYL
jgi:predicted AlkP superfamily phosphohydrolase/phosphomutase